MNDKPLIKIVKKDDASTLKVTKRKRPAPRNAAGEMVSTVSAWVADLKARKSVETQTALNIFRGSNLHPNET